MRRVVDDQRDAWADSHLHRFSLGGHPFDRTSQLFLCPYDVEEGEEDDDGGIPVTWRRCTPTRGPRPSRP